MVKEFLLELSRYELGRLRLQSVSLPPISRFNTAFQLVNLHKVAHMVPSALLQEFYPDDFLFVPIIPYLSEDEYLNIYGLLAYLQARGVNWCLELPIDAPHLDELFLSNSKVSIRAVSVTYDNKVFPYLHITTYTQK